MNGHSPRDGVGDGREIYERRQLKEIAARWDARADAWDRELQDPACHLNEDDAYARFTRVAQHVISQRPEFCAARGVIDAGCGTGLVLASVCSSFAWGVGVDISPEMIRVAQSRHIANAKFLVGDCFDLSSLAPKAGVVLSRGVLLSHYGREQGQGILAAARSALVPGGFLIFDFLNQAARTQYRHAPENKTWFRAAEIEEMALAAGFSEVSMLGEPSRRVRYLLGETGGGA